MIGPTRRKFVIGATTAAFTALAGCIEGELVDTNYDCPVNEPTSTPQPERPTIGPEDATTTTRVYIDYSHGTSGRFIRNSLEKLEEDYVTESKTKIVFHDLTIPADTDWTHQLSSVGRFLYATEGEEAYKKFLLGTYQDYPEFSWQSIGDIASETGADPCETIAHGSWKSYENEINEDREQAIANGFTEAPTVTVNDERVNNLGPVQNAYNEISEAIEDALDGE